MSKESDACGRLCCGAQRGFVMHITDNFGAVRIYVDNLLEHFIKFIILFDNILNILRRINCY